MLTGHTLDTIFVLDCAFPMVALSLVCIVLVVMTRVFTKWMTRLGYVISKQ